ncbi:MAG TPA: glutathione S-transferase family protein [Candidatus Binataceae bacterium]|nr:glutathione S-transferase family protein [Candidatus Binataceae bacterium]
MLKLYEHPLSPYAQKVKLSLYEKGIEFEAAMPNLFGNDQEFARVSPRREVPALVDGNTAIFDSTIILEYIEDKWPKPPMLPESPAERARVRMLEDLCDTYYEAINWGLAEVNFFKRATGDLANRITEAAAKQIAGVHQWLERELGNREWFNGASFGWGDLSVLPYVNGSVGFGFAPSAGSRLAKWHAAANSRPSAKKCAEAVAPVMAGFQQASTLIESGAMVREYRDHRLEWMMRSGGKQVVLDGMEKKNIRFHVDIT